MKSNYFEEPIESFAFIKPLLNLVCHYHAVYPSLTFDREYDAEVGESGSTTAPGRTFKCKCTFYLYLYANELFSRWERRTRDSPMTQRAREISSPVRSFGKKQLGTQCRKTIIASSARNASREIMRRNFKNFNHWQQLRLSHSRRPTSMTIRSRHMTYYFLIVDIIKTY